MKTNAIKFIKLNPTAIRPMGQQRLIQSGQEFSITEKAIPYDVNKDVAVFLHKKYPAEYERQLALGNIPAVKSNRQNVLNSNLKEAKEDTVMKKSFSIFHR